MLKPALLPPGIPDMEREALLFTQHLNTCCSDTIHMKVIQEKQEKNKRESERFFTFVQILCNIET